MHIYIYIIKHRPQLVNTFSYMAGPLYSDSWYQTIHVRLSLYPMFIHNHMSRILLCPSEEEFLFSIRSMSKIAWAYGMEVRRVLFAIVCKVLKSRVIPNGKHRAIWRWGCRGVGSTGPVNHDLCVNPSIVHVEELARYGWERRETSEMC